MSKLPAWVFNPTKTPDAAALKAAQARQAVLTKPRGALGQLEDIAVRLAGLQGRAAPALSAPHIVLFAGDHGIVEEGVSAYPSDVTGQMLANFVNGGAAISVLARALDARLEVVDVGTLLAVAPQGVHEDKVARGTGNFRHHAAMSELELCHGFEAGRRATERAVDLGADFLIFGEMGIGNTSAASAVSAALLQFPARDVVGAGTGLNQASLDHKVRVIEESLAFHGFTVSDPAPDPAAVLMKVGGHEIVALVGAMISAAQCGVPVLVDGFICSATALAATHLNPGVAEWFFFSHQSAEAGHAPVLQALRAHPLLSLGLRLGEGSGAALAYPLIEHAVKLHSEMATFESAGVSTAT
ncbi:MAG: nicotinate-nucleotide--dimethylbenzimidazole phosphoribosyltransferase [Parvibaculum sp.]